MICTKICGTGRSTVAVPAFCRHNIFFCLFPLTVADPLKEIANEHHQHFMKEYIREWPFLPQTDYMVGAAINAELNGVQQKCVVEVVDCSLIRVLFLVSTC